MNNYLYEMPNNWYKNFNNTFIPNNYSTNNYNNKTYTTNNLATPKDGFLKGNLFNNLYDPYKNYKYQELIPNNQREELLYTILKYKFALIELNLYLDVNPNNQEYINLYNKYLTEEKNYCKKYESMYGPLTLDDTNKNNTWDWVKSPWPWEVTK